MLRIGGGAEVRTRILWMSALAGAVGGLTSAAYLGALAFAERWMWPGSYQGYRGALVHAAVFLVTGCVISMLLGVLGDPGETGVLIDSVHGEGGPATLRELSSLVPVSLLSIAAGGGIGPEPPLMQTTATLGAWLGRRLRVDRAELRILSVTGMAAGLTVLFAAPLGAAIFALEILHRRGLEYYEALLPACVGSLSSYGVYTLLTGHDLGPLWPIAHGPPSVRPADLAVGLAAGVAGAAVGHVFGFLLKVCRWLAATMPGWSRPLAAGAVLAVLGFAIPTGLTYGDAQIADLVQDSTVTAALLATTAVGHLLSATVTLAGRWRGGIIIPMFLVGYCLGRATEAAAGHNALAPTLGLTMMVACNVALTKTPLGSALVIAQAAGTAELPAMVVAGLTSLALSARVVFIGGQAPRDLSLHLRELRDLQDLRESRDPESAEGARGVAGSGGAGPLEIERQDRSEVSASSI